MNRWALGACLLVACSEDTAENPDGLGDSTGTNTDSASDSAVDTATDSGEDSGWVDSGAQYELTFECPPSNDYVGAEPHSARVLSGTATWEIDFDETAEAAGNVDCSYTRVYGPSVEREGFGWQCPACDFVTAGEAEVVDGYDDCTRLISSSDAVRIENLGLGTVDGVQHFWRAGSQNLDLGDMGATEGAGTESSPYHVAWEDEGELDAGGTFVLQAAGEFVASETSSVLIEDVGVPRQEAYGCGWEQCNPGGPTESYELTTGGIFPNARLTDSCGDQVDLWDFWGRYIVFDSSAPDCGPCIVLAEAEAAWAAQMAARGIEVEWVTLLNESLSAINLPADSATMEAWISGTGTGGAVLADEGFAYSVMPKYTGSESGMSYPTMVVVSPDMTVLGWDSGFSSVENGGDGFGPIETLIFRDADQRTGL